MVSGNGWRTIVLMLFAAAVLLMISARKAHLPSFDRCQAPKALDRQRAQVVQHVT
jgi:hypothetical protein